MENQTSLLFNPKPPTILHIDLNSCFATIEQQANPKLRGKPIAVAAYTTPSGCIVAPSIEAKKLGISVGMRVKDGKLIYPGLIVLPPDPDKYRSIHLRFKQLLSQYTDDVTPKSIDEFVLNLEGYPAYKKGMVESAREIKARIKHEIGEWLTVSVGIGPNRFLAKTAAGLNKPDGLDVIDKNNYHAVYEKLELGQLCGIKTQNAIRLNNMGIFTVLDFYDAPVLKLKAAFESICGYYWHVRLHGWEMDDVAFARKSFGNSYALPKKLCTPQQLSPLLQKLVQKATTRMRKAGYRARGVHVAIVYRDHHFWHKGVSGRESLFDCRDIYAVAYRLLLQSPYHSPVRELAVSCFNLSDAAYTQTSLFDDVIKKEKLNCALDTIQEKYGDFVITPARMMGMQHMIVDRISYGNIKELTDTVLSN